MSDPTYTKLIENLYSGATRVADLDVVKTEGDPLTMINGEAATDTGLRSILNCAGIPLGLYKSASVDLKKRMLSEMTVGADLWSCSYDGHVIGVMPDWKHKTKPVLRFIERFGEDVDYPGDPRNDSRIINFHQLDEFNLADSKYYLGASCMIEMFGDRTPMVSLAIQRTACTNSIIREFAKVKPGMDSIAWSSMFDTFYEVLKKQGPVVQDCFERSKEVEENALDMITQTRLSARLPKKALQLTPVYIETVNEGNEELPHELLNTRFGTVNVISAVAREMPSYSAHRVSATAFSHLLELAEAA